VVDAVRRRSQEYAYELELDAFGRPVIAGTAYGFTTTDFPATPGAYDEEIDPAFSEVFAARLAADGSRLEWATAFGGRDWDDGLGMALDAQGDVHMAGQTESNNFPTTPGAYDRVCNVVYETFSCTNHADAFALELSADGSRLLASTYLGGGGADDARGIALDGAGRAYLTGATASSGFPLLGAFQRELRNQGDFCASRSDCSDAYVMRLSADKARVEYSSFLGGRSYDAGEGIALAGGDAWVSGFTHSADLPTTPGAPRASAPGGDCGFFRVFLEFKPCADAFVSRVGPQSPPAPPPNPTTGQSPSPPPPGDPGPTPGGTTPPGGRDPAVVTSPRRIRAWRTRRGVRGRATGDRACVRRVPVVLSRRAGGRWRRVAASRSSPGGRFAFTVRRSAARYRVRLPVLTRTLADAHRVRCAAASARVQRRR
jgi:hypothetical protein